MTTSQNDDQDSIGPLEKDAGLVRRSEFLPERVRRLAQQVRSVELTERFGRQDARAYFDRALSRFHMGQYEQAKQDFRDRVGLDPTYAFAHVVRGLSRSCLLQYEQAVQDFDQAIELFL